MERAFGEKKETLQHFLSHLDILFLPMMNEANIQSCKSYILHTLSSEESRCMSKTQKRCNEEVYPPNELHFHTLFRNEVN